MRRAAIVILACCTAVTAWSFRVGLALVGCWALATASMLVWFKPSAKLEARERKLIAMHKTNRHYGAE